jgi:hypothetical protein
MTSAGSGAVMIIGNDENNSYGHFFLHRPKHSTAHLNCIPHSSDNSTLNIDIKPASTTIVTGHDAAFFSEQNVFHSDRE